MADGTLLSTGVNQLGAAGIQPKTVIQMALTIFTKHSNGDPIPYLDDRSHLIFAVVLATGGCFASVFLRKLHSTFNRLAGESLPSKNAHQSHMIYKRYRIIANHWLGRLISLLIALPVLGFFLALHHDQQLQHWWGSSIHGHAGLLFSITEFLMVYYGVQGLLMMTCAALMIRSMFKQELNLQPFHPDRCNGLFPVGELILYVWLSSIALAAAIFVATYFGYLGLESTPIVFLLATLGTVTIALIAILPLSAVASAVSHAQYVILAQLAPTLNMRVSANREPNPIDWERASRLLESYKMVRDVNVWPFSSKALSLLVAIYVVQVLMIVSKLVESVRVF
jgi:hypothetical protein